MLIKYNSMTKYKKNKWSFITLNIFIFIYSTPVRGVSTSTFDTDIYKCYVFNTSFHPSVYINVKTEK